MATYRFYANMSISEEIEVEADSYDEAFDLAHVEANNNYSVLTPTGFSACFDDIQIEDSYIPEED
jgi:hypothetical protein